jgi:hypothetical protein
MHKLSFSVMSTGSAVRVAATLALKRTNEFIIIIIIFLRRYVIATT